MVTGNTTTATTVPASGGYAYGAGTAGGTPGAPAPGSTGNTSGIDPANFIAPRDFNMPVIVGSSDTAIGLPGAAGYGPGTRTLSQAIQGLSNLSYDDLIKLQTDLYAGRFYSATYYSANAVPIVPGELDNATISAYVRALQTAAHTHVDVRTIIDNGDQTAAINGVGTTAARQSITGGGQIYTLHLTNPDDITRIADVVAKELTGKGASKAEQAAIVAAVQGPQLGNFQTDTAAKEAQSLDVYRSRVEQRNELQPQPALANAGKAGAGAPTAAQAAAASIYGPGGPLGPSAGSGTTRVAFANSILAGLGAPQTSANSQALLAWMQAESGASGGAAFNPLNTTLGAPGAGNFNSVGVKNFVSYEQGVQATVSTISQANMAPIKAALMTGTDSARLSQAVSSTQWGTGPFGGNTASGNVSVGTGGTTTTGGQDAYIAPQSLVDVGAPSPDAAASSVIRQMDPAGVTQYGYVEGMQGMIDAMQANRQSISLVHPAP